MIEPFHDHVNVKITFEEINNIYETYFTQEILQKEIESFKNALYKDIFAPIGLDHPRRKYLLSFLKSVLMLIMSALLFIVILLTLLNLFNTSSAGPIVGVILAGIIVIGLNFLYAIWRRKRIQKRINSTIT
jgi:hypothetical protein